MVDLILIIPIVICFFVTLFVTPIWIKKARRIELMWEDVNKIDRPKVAGSGGLIVILGFVIGVLIYIAYRVFYLGQANNFLVEIFALLTVVLILGGVGLIDDLLGWRHGGLRIRTRLVLVALAAIPLVVINAGRSNVAIPFFGNLELGIFYPLFFIPLGIMGASTTFNFLAGFNGEEAGQGIILLSALALVAYLTGSGWIGIILLCMVASLLAFLIFNFYPAKIFPGDSLTYVVGGLIAIVAIIGNFERIALFFFIPYILETGLKLKGGLVKHSFGEPIYKGYLNLRYKKFYSLNHIAIYLLNKSGLKATERRVVVSIWCFQLIIVIIGFLIFREGLF
ncbi:MAG: glycosyl transferase family 4 [Nanoarchaeota archaeon]|nr:glycosyl transferase family 4 [Nanoarchaeota archaeon]